MRNTTSNRIFLLLLSFLFFGIVSVSFAAAADPLANWHWRNPLPQGDSLAAVAYGNGKFVAVGGWDSGTILSSSDGITWGIHNVGIIDVFDGVTYGNNIFVAVGDSGTILTSPDGATWTKRRSGTTERFLCVAYGNGVFVAAGWDLMNGYGTILTSPDGMTWSAQKSRTTARLMGVTYGNGQFVGLDGNGIVTSVDGATWKAQNWITNNVLYAVAFGAGQFVAVGDSGTIFTSPDGVTWKEQNSGTNSTLYGIAYGDGRFVSVGWDEYGTIFTSPDGVTWKGQNSATNSALLGVTYGNGVFISVGSSGLILSSVDGKTWTAVSGTTNYLQGVTYGSGKFVAAGTLGTIVTSPDGVTWSVQKSVTKSNLNGLTYGNGNFVAVGDTVILNSPDGLTWTTQKAGAPYWLWGVTYGNKKFVAVGIHGKILSSPDGLTWTAQKAGTTAHLFGVTYGNGKFVAVGDTVILSSPDGLTWTTEMEGSPYWLRGVAYGNGRFVAVGYSGTILSSSNDSGWTLRTSGTTDKLFGVTYENGRFVVAGAYGYYDGVMRTSPDGTTWTRQYSSVIDHTLYGVTYGKMTFVAVGGAGRILQSEPIPPTLLSAVSSTSNGYYKAGSTVNITLHFTEPVSSSGLTIKLNSGASISTGPFNSQASYGGTYTVAAGENSSGLNISSITGTITDAGGLIGIPVVPPGSNISDSKTIVIDTTPPKVAISGPSASITKSGPVNYTVTYNDSNFNSSTLTAADVSLNATGSANGVISSVTGTGNKRSVTISSIAGSGTIGISIASGTATDKAGNTAPSSGPSATFAVDNTPPTLGALTPSKAVTKEETMTTFVSVYGDADGYANLKTVDLLVGPQNGAGAIWMKYNQTTNQLYLASDTGTFPTTGCTPGSTGTLQNSQGILSCSSTVSVSGNNLTVSWKILPRAVFASITAKNLWMIARDTVGLTSGWVKKGTWIVAP